jgi:hypothetical protein
MIKTLRITIIVTAIVAGLFFILSAMFGLRRDKDKEAFLAGPSITATIKKGTANPDTVEQEVPLIKQAQSFALRINPPKPVESVSIVVQKPIDIPKFRLLGTSYYPDEPNRSMALIDEPGKGMHWVVASDKVGYLTITQIVDGKIGYTDGQKNMEMLVEKPQTPQQISVISVNGEVVPAAAGTPGQLTAAVPVSPQVATAESATPAPADIAPTPEQLKENAEFIRKLINDPNSVGVNPAEANELKGLGEFLKQLETEQAAAEANQPKAEANLPPKEPNVEKTKPNRLRKR